MLPSLSYFYEMNKYVKLVIVGCVAFALQSCCALFGGIPHGHGPEVEYTPKLNHCKKACRFIEQQALKVFCFIAA